jgi:hypothetical protein
VEANIMACWIARRSVQHKYFVEREVLERSDNIAAPTARTEEAHIAWKSSLFDCGNRWTGGPIILRLRLLRRRVSLPHTLPTGDTWIVSETFRRLVEEREPALHQFFKVDIKKRDNGDWPVPYYLFNVCETTFAVIFEKSKIQKSVSPWGNTIYSRPYHDDDLTLSSDINYGKHVWKEGMFPHLVFLSDEMKNAFQSSGIDTLEFTRVQEVIGYDGKILTWGES